MRRLAVLAIAILFMLACATLDVTTPAPVATATEFPVIIPYPMQTARFALTDTATPEPIAATPRVFPPWVAEFSDPIMKAVESVKPAFEDDFPSVCINKRHEWKICATPERRLNYQYPLYNLVTSMPRPTLDLQPDLQNGYSVVNQGWFYIVPGSDKNPFYAHIENSELVLKLPEGELKKDLRVSNPYLRRKNFVLKFEFQFKDTQPTDAVRFEFTQSSNESFALDLVKNKTWTLHWGSRTNWQSHTGTYAYFPPDPLEVVIIARGTQCAVYVNHNPLDYVENCRSGAVVESSPQAVSIHLLGQPGYVSMATFDNFMLWDLDEVQGLP